jgi:hypothetical protein
MKPQVAKDTPMATLLRMQFAMQFCQQLAWGIWDPCLEPQIRSGLTRQVLFY